MRKWTEREMNILFAVIAKVRDKSTTSICLEMSEIKNLIQSKKNITKNEFIQDIKSIAFKLSDLKFIEDNENEFIVYNVYNTFKFNKEMEILEVQVHERFEYIFNKIGMEFTQFELEEFIKINSTYAKTAFRLLKQFRTTGWWKVMIEDFKSLLDIPKSYRSSDIDKHILKPILEQLGGNDDQAIFKHLKVTKHKKKGRGRGGVLTGYTFSFEKEATVEWIDNKYGPKKKVRKESLPDWAKDDYEFKETKLSAEEEASFRKEIEQLRNN